MFRSVLILACSSGFTTLCQIPEVGSATHGNTSDLIFSFTDAEVRLGKASLWFQHHFYFPVCARTRVCPCPRVQGNEGNLRGPSLPFILFKTGSLVNPCFVHQVLELLGQFCLVEMLRLRTHCAQRTRILVTHTQTLRLVQQVLDPLGQLPQASPLLSLKAALYRSDAMNPHLDTGWSWQT